MAQLMMHRNILKNFHKLPSKVQKRVSELIDEFQRDPQSPAIGLHPLSATMRDPKVRGVKKLPDGYRAIVIAPDKGDTYLLVHIDAHDKAYDWAKNKLFEIHKMTGVFQIIDSVEVEQATQVPEFKQYETKPDYPLGRMSEEELFDSGVPKPLIPAVQSIKSDDGLEAISEYLPPDCRDVLYGIAAGMSVEEALLEMLNAEPATASTVVEGTGDFTKIEQSPNFDLVLVEGQEELKKILAGTLEEWRIFLHPCQRKLVHWQPNGPMNITGAAGTGKTVALLHRAVWLANRLEAAKDRVLVTTFTTNLSTTLEGMVKRLDPVAAKRIDVVNLHSLARTICQRSGWNGRIADGDAIAQIWKDVWAMNTTELPLSKDEMQLEFEIVVDPNGINDQDAYISTVRSARPRISRAQRKAAWPVFLAFRRGLKKRNLLTFDGAIYEARLAVEAGKLEKYAHVLVDEAQDFSLDALRLIRAISPIESAGANPLTLAGDGHQRLYRNRIPMSRAGIDIRGRSRRLKINYRTSEQIRKYAQGILHGVTIDDLDGGESNTLGDHSVFKGPEPIIERCADEKSEAEAIVDWIKMLQLDCGLSTHEICITPNKPSIRQAIASAGLPTKELKPREQDPGSDEPGIRMGTMKRIKGLEFRAVAMACSDEADAINDLSNADVRDRCERYVAATRAVKYLLITVKD